MLKKHQKHKGHILGFYLRSNYFFLLYSLYMVNVTQSYILNKVLVFLPLSH